MFQNKLHLAILTLLIFAGGENPSSTIQRSGVVDGESEIAAWVYRIVEQRT